MTDEAMPDWALIEAGKQCGWANAPESLRDIYRWTNPAFHALCDMILQHEQPPVDRKVLCAREAIGQHYEADGSPDLAAYYRSGQNDEFETMKTCIRAIELWEEGFGK